jgi:hypothetical protein
MMKNEQNHYNTTTLLPNSVNVVKSTRTMLKAVKRYLNQSFRPAKLLNQPEYANYTPTSDWNMPIYNNWLKGCPSASMVSPDKALALHDYQREIFADPIGNNLCPFNDGLAFTIDLPDESVDELSNALRKMKLKDFKLFRTGPCTYLKNTQEKFENFAIFKDKRNNEVFFFWGLSEAIKTARPNQRNAKVAFNPARFKPHQINNFFKYIKRSDCFDYTELMPIANVTRTDNTMDMYGFHLCNFIFDKPNVSIINDYQNEYSHDHVLIGTVKVGSPTCSNLTAYDKLFKIISGQSSLIPLLTYPNGKFVPITRIERKYKPADGKAIILDCLGDAPYFLADTNIYSPIVIRELNNDERDIVSENGFLDWLYVQAKAERRAFILDFLSKNKLLVNHESLYSQQTKQLRLISELILNV